ncbi:Phage integrase family protein [Geodermatophilus obscurus]|uniref:Phage integrase family protein n=1 Tax=Geodermatophilus obscurus TaxID=1861 RepID=A0A1M7UKN7_9ACTN|nr:tyrosine-type recombinase/integrase [Geodermatophilus obscurus]SHN83539.1 Phage integrase family protein [Geodermatophilus obscurus]
MLSDLDGTHRHPERFSRRFAAGQVAQARKALGEEQLPGIRLHDLRHTHATLPLADGVPVKVVSERLGHASGAITLTVYQHVHPGTGRQARRPLAGPALRLISREVSQWYHEGLGGPDTEAPRAPELPDTGALLGPRATPHIRTRHRAQVRQQW